MGKLISSLAQCKQGISLIMCRRVKPLALILLLDQGRWKQILIRAPKYTITAWRRTNEKPNMYLDIFNDNLSLIVVEWVIIKLRDKFLSVRTKCLNKHFLYSWQKSVCNLIQYDFLRKYKQGRAQSPCDSIGWKARHTWRSHYNRHLFSLPGQFLDLEHLLSVYSSNLWYACTSFAWRSFQNPSTMEQTPTNE